MALCGGPAPAQIPEEFKNLKVLPPEIDPRELVGLMRSYASALGVRCWHCHVGEEGKPLSEFDFPSDAKREKRAAREMIRMVREINATIGRIDTGHDPRQQVSCETCHRGLERPRRIGDIVREAYAAGGLDAALAKYKELRDAYYGGYSYDFGQGPLNMFAEELARSGKLDEALRVQTENAGYNPKADYVQFNIGQIYEQKGDRAKAIEQYTKALALSPGNDFYRRALDKLQGAGG
jgi:tetratricopeptide (TPR) repeat protein